MLPEKISKNEYKIHKFLDELKIEQINTKEYLMFKKNESTINAKSKLNFKIFPTKQNSSFIQRRKQFMILQTMNTQVVS